MNYADFYLLKALSNWAPVEIAYSAPPPRSDDLQSLASLLDEADHYDIFSFDIFDTLLRRDVEPPELVKRATMQALRRRLADVGHEIPLARLLELRDTAEGLARQALMTSGDDPECTLTEIFGQLYQQLHSTLHFDAETAISIADLVSLELRYETGRLSAMPGAVSTLLALRQRGKRIVLISDMYLEQAHIEALLSDNGLLSLADSVHVSSDARRSKGSGRLFHALISNGTLKPGSTLHTGDHPISDFKRPLEAGLAARLFRPHEEGLRRARISAQHRAALHFGDLDLFEALDDANYSDRSAAFLAGLNCFGPAFTLYTIQLIELALDGKHREVFFLARDGFIFQKLYDRLREGLHPFAAQETPPSRYIHISRPFAKFAEIRDLERGLIDKINPTNRQFGIGPLLQSLGLEPERYRALVDAALAGHGETNAKDISVDSLRVVLENKSFIAALAEDQQAHRALLRDYLTQEGFLRPGCALVADIGWAGSILDSLEAAFGDDPEFPQLEAAFFGSSRAEAHDTPRVHYSSGFAFDKTRPNAIESLINQTREVFEAVASSPEGQVLGYQRERDGRIGVRLGPEERTLAEQAVIDDVQAGILESCDRIIRLINRFHPNPEQFRAASILRLVGLVSGRYPAESACLEALQFSLGWGQGNRVQLKELLGFSPANAASAAPACSADALKVSVTQDGASTMDLQRLFERLQDLVERLKLEDRIVFYGVGTVSRMLAPLLGERIVCFVDRNAGLQNQSFLGRPIHPPERLADFGDCTLFVTPIKRKTVIAPMLAEFKGHVVFLDDCF